MIRKCKVLVTGSQGFVAGYIIKELLSRGYEVVGIDNLIKYGNIVREHDNHKDFTFYKMDLREDFRKIRDTILLVDPDYIIHCAARLGGIKYFHDFSYDLLHDNSIIDSNIFSAAVALSGKLVSDNFKRIIVLSSSMVYENTNIYPSTEDSLKQTLTPSSTYGFSKLATEYKCKGAWEQYHVPFTIIRPFNCCGIGEDDFLEDRESHVIPDLIVKCLQGQDPLHIYGNGNQIRCYTHGSDIARGICFAMESDKAINEDFNISTPISTSVLELAEKIWNKINLDKPFRYICDKSFVYDVSKRVPDISKAKNLLGFEAKISLDESIDEVITYIKSRINV